MVQPLILDTADQPNTISNNKPLQANQTHGRGYFNAPSRSVNGPLIREDDDSFADVWTQPRLFLNSLMPAEQQQVVDAIRFETSNIESAVIRQNVIIQLNKVSHELAALVAPAIGIAVPEPDPQYYHNDTTKGITILGERLPTVAGMKVGVLATVDDDASMAQAAELKEKFAAEKVSVLVVGERLDEGVDMTYSATRAHAFDGVIVAGGAEKLFDPSFKTPLFPPGRPGQTLEDAYRWGKPIGAMGPAAKVYDSTAVEDGPGVFVSNDADDVVLLFKEGLSQFKFVDRFPMDEMSLGGVSAN